MKSLLSRSELPRAKTPEESTLEKIAATRNLILWRELEEFAAEAFNLSTDTRSVESVNTQTLPSIRNLAATARKALFDDAPNQLHRPYFWNYWPTPVEVYQFARTAYGRHGVYIGSVSSSENRKRSPRLIPELDTE